MRLYIVRHADPDYVNDSITAKGRLEAEALAKRFSAQGLDRIYCSPQGRAIATMKYTQELTKTDFEIEQWTREVWPELFVKNGESGYKAMFQLPGESTAPAAACPPTKTGKSARFSGKTPPQGKPFMRCVRIPTGFWRAWVMNVPAVCTAALSRTVTV